MSVLPIIALKWIPFERDLSQPDAPEFVFRTAGGQEYRKRVVHLTGDADTSPLSDDILLAKFDDCAGPILPSKQRARVKELILRLEDVPSVRALTKALAG
jgi:hypothetical protein